MCLKKIVSLLILFKKIHNPIVQACVKLCTSCVIFLTQHMVGSCFAGFFIIIIIFFFIIFFVFCIFFGNSDLIVYITVFDEKTVHRDGH